MSQPKTVRVTLFGVKKVFFNIKLCLLLFIFFLSWSHQTSDDELKKKFIEIHGYDPEQGPPEPTETPVSSTPGPNDQTALAQSAILDALNLDVGVYTTQRFDYFNQQNFRIKRTRYDEGRCYDDYIRCLLSQSNMYAVCAMHTRSYFVNLDSYCDVFLDNCRRGYRFWLTYRQGPCKYKNTSYSYPIYSAPFGSYG